MLAPKVDKTMMALLKIKKEENTEGIIWPDNQQNRLESSQLLHGGKVDISSCKMWDPEDQEGAKTFHRDFIDISATKDLDLGKTSMVKHKIKLKKGAEPLRINIAGYL